MQTGVMLAGMGWQKENDCPTELLLLTSVTRLPCHALLQCHTISCSVKITYVNKDGSKKEVVGKEGQNLLHLAHENEIDLEGACECSCACSTCHVILEDKVYRDLEPATDEEEDLLDLAFGLTST